MAALKSILEFTFNSEPTIGSEISFVLLFGSHEFPIPMIAVDVITGLNQFALAPDGYVGDKVAFAVDSYADALITNQNVGIQCEVNTSASIITMVARYDIQDFANIVVPPSVTYYYSRSSFTIDNVSVFNSIVANKNTHVRYLFQVSNGVEPYIITNPTFKEAPTTSDLIIEWYRNIEHADFGAWIYDANGRFAYVIMPTVDKISDTAVSTAALVVNPDSSVTLTVSAAIIFGDISVVYSYSLDGTTWQSSNVFNSSGITEESVFVKDNYGALVSIPITIPSVFSISGVGIINDIVGARVSVNVEVTSGSPILEYSLDGVSWQSSNIFYLVQHGDYTAYAKEGPYPPEEFEFSVDEVENSRIEGFYDYSKDEYGVKIPGEGMWHFSHTNQGWTHKIEASPDIILYDGLGLYSFDGQDLYKHGELTDGKFNTFYGAELPISFEISANDGYSDVKTLHSLFIEGNKGIVEIKDQKGDITTIPEVLFENKEGNWHAFIPMNSISSDSINMIGLGVVISNDILSAGVLRLNFGTDIKSPQVGDVIRATGASGDFSVKDGNSVTITSATSSFEGKFAYVERNNIISGDYMRGNYFLLKFTVEDSTQNINVFAINLEAKKSNV